MSNEKPSVIILTETDIAAVPLAGDQGYIFRLDESHKGPFHGAIALSQLRDPDVKERSVQSLKAQFADIPYPEIRENFLNETGIMYVVGSLMTAHKLATTGGNVEKTLEAKRAAARPLMDALGPNAMAELEPFLKSENPRSLVNGVASVIRENWPSTPHSKEAFAREIQAAAKKYDLPEIKTVRDMEGHVRPVSVSLSDFNATQDILRDPHKAAVKHYEAMRAEAIAKNITPETPASTYAGHVSEALELCPPHIAALANARQTHVVVVGDHKMPGLLKPEEYIPHEIDPTEVALSSGKGIYLKDWAVRKPAIAVEEFLHEVERHTTPEDGQYTSFSSQPEWDLALAKDAANAPGNAVYQYLLKESDARIARLHGVGKGNTTLAQKGLSSDLDVHASAEAVPDIYNIAAAADELLAKDRRISIGDETYFTGTAAMHAALPNSWQMLEGPAADMQLIQHSDGTVKQIARDAAIPKDALSVMSLKETCEGLIADKNIGTVEELANAFGRESSFGKSFSGERLTRTQSATQTRRT